MTNQPALPAFFEELLSQQYDAEDVKRIIDGCSVKRPVTLRANTLLSSRDEVVAALNESGLAFEGVNWYEDAFIVDGAQERDLWNLPIYQQGKIYLQSLSSMMPALILDAQAGEDICDMCAAPGGKTTQIAALAGNKAYVTACEMHAPRAEKLEHNLRKLGTKGITVMRTDARQLDEFFSFDRVLLDAPCSGSGTLRASDERTAKRFTPKLVQKSQKSQRALFAKALGMLKPGSTLIYSTCSVLACENEDIVEQGLRQMRKKGKFELQPIVASALPIEKVADDARATANTAPEAKIDASANSTADAKVDTMNDAFFTVEQAMELPLLPTRLEGALCLAPTDLYEGFFIAKIKRTA